MARVESGVRTFKKVWCQFDPPRRSFFAYQQRAKGTLTIGPDGVRFTSEKLSWRSERIGGVGIGAVGTDLVNRWIVAEVGETEHGNVVFLMDGRWWGWHSILSNTLSDIVDALSAIATGATDGTAAPVAAELHSKDGLSQWIWQHPWMTASILGAIPAFSAVSTADDGDWAVAGLEIALVIGLFALFGSAALRRRDRK
jgi:hypothetical protein